MYADADDVELFVNGESAGSQPIGIDQEYRASFDVEYQPGSIEAVAKRNGAEVGRMVIKSVGAEMHLVAMAERAHITADPSDLAYVRLSLVDADGRVNITDDREITISVSGPAALQGLCSANPMSTDNFTGNTCRTFNGSALAVIRPTGEGAITVSAVAVGGLAATATITAR